MPSNRTPTRPPPRRQISAEALALFLELEALPQDSERFKTGSRKLAAMLDLKREWWGRQHVNDRSPRPRHPPHLVAHHDWHRVRTVRLTLLAAAGLESASARLKSSVRPSAPHLA
jgi:hypothetical protein